MPTLHWSSGPDHLPPWLLYLYRQCQTWACGAFASSPSWSCHPALAHRLLSPIHPGACLAGLRLGQPAGMPAQSVASQSWLRGRAEVWRLRLFLSEPSAVLCRATSPHLAPPRCLLLRRASAPRAHWAWGVRGGPLLKDMPSAASMAAVIRRMRYPYAAPLAHFLLYTGETMLQSQLWTYWHTTASRQ